MRLRRRDAAEQRGEEHNWRRAIGDALLKQQLENGGWSNTKNSAFRENTPLIATSYALVAPGHLD